MPFLIRSVVAAVALSFAASAAAMAETPMDGAAFERYTEGRTLSFNAGGVPYGIEQYLPGRRVLWAFVGQECQEGVWYERGDMICFAYDKTSA